MKRKRLSTKQGYWGAKKTKKAATPYGRPYYKNNSYNLYKSPRLGWPQEWMTTLKYSIQGTLNNTPAAVATRQFNSDAFDVDPALGSTAMPGFTELSGLYSRYRVIAMGYDLEVCNRELFALQVMSGIVNNSVAWNTVELLGNSNVKTQIISAKGGMDRVRLKDRITMVALFGSKQPLYDDLYTGSTTATTLATNATAKTYFSILSPSVGLTAGGGCDYNIQIYLQLQFYRANPLIG